MLFRILMLLGVATLLGGCMHNKYTLSPEAEAEASSSIKFIRDKDLGHNSNARYEILSSLECEAEEGYGIAANLYKIMWMGPGKRTVKVQDGEPLFIRAISMNHGASVSSICTNVSSFTAKPGVDYQIAQEFSGESCRMDISVLSGEDEAIDFMPLPVVDYCKE